MNSPRIVDDLIPVILESNGHWWPKDLQRLALVSTAWVGPIRRLLYACPKLSSFHACTLFVRTVSSNPHILSLVQGLELCPVSDGLPLTEEHMASLRFALNLKGLLSVTLGGELAVRAERFVQMMSNTHSITSLHIDGSHLNRYHCLGTTTRHCPSLSWDDSIAFRFSRSLRSLRLTQLHLSISEADIPYAIRVQNLTLDGVSIESGFVQDLLHESWTHLRHLSISSATPATAEDIAIPLLECCENLESLRYEACVGGIHGELFEESTSLTALRKLRLYDIDVNPQTLASLSQTCGGLAQISVLGRTVRLTAQDWVQLIQSSAMPSLRVLKTSSGCPQSPSGFLRWTEESCDELRSACATRGISLSYE